MTLNELAIKYGSDKSDMPSPNYHEPHDYCKYYEFYLPKQPESILEIGCMHGASLKMWKDFYPNAFVATFDLFQNKEFASQESIQALGIKAYKGDQNYTDDLSKIEEQYEVIIDDGSHRSDHQLISLKHLWENNLLTSGLYVVEDIHCNSDPFYRMGMDFNNTILGMAKQDRIHELFTDIEKWILVNDKIIFIWKK